MQTPRNYLFAAGALASYVAAAPPWLARTMGRVRPYPRPFQRFLFHSADGTRLSSWIGIQRNDTGKPVRRHGIVLVPGLFITKDNAVHRARAWRIFSQLGYHVLAMDLRGTGESKRAFHTAGWKEAEDLRAAIAAFRKRAPLERVHVYAESLAAVAAILAAAEAAREGQRLVDGAVIAVSPFPDAKRLVQRLSRPRQRADTLAIVRWFFQQLMTLGGGREKTFAAYLRSAASAYDISLNELYRRSTLKDDLADVNVPLLLINADDDPLVPRRDVDELAQALRGRTNPALLRLPWGSHCLFELIEPVWFWSVLQEFLEFYCVLPSPPPRSTKRF